jgi:hypothetical protein
VLEEAECKLRSISWWGESDPGRAFQPAFRLAGIADDWYRSTMSAVGITLGAPGTIAQPMRESQTNYERCMGPYRYSFQGLQGLSEILLMDPEQ